MAVREKISATAGGLLLVCVPALLSVHAQQHLAPECAVYLLPSSHGFRGKRKGDRGRFIPVPELEEPYGRLPGLDIMLHSQINAHKESLPFLMSKKWEAVHSKPWQAITYLSFRLFLRLYSSSKPKEVKADPATASGRTGSSLSPVEARAPGSVVLVWEAGSALVSPPFSSKVTVTSRGTHFHWAWTVVDLETSVLSVN